MSSGSAGTAWFSGSSRNHLLFRRIKSMPCEAVKLWGRFYSLCSRFLPVHRYDCPLGKLNAVRCNGVTGHFSKRLMTANRHNFMGALPGVRQSAASRFAQPARRQSVRRRPFAVAVDHDFYQLAKPVRETSGVSGFLCSDTMNVRLSRGRESTAARISGCIGMLISCRFFY